MTIIPMRGLTLRPRLGRGVSPTRQCLPATVHAGWSVLGRFLAALTLTLLLITPPASAHESIGTVSNAIAMVDGATVDYFLSVPAALKPTMFSTSELAWYREYFASTLKLRSGDADCPLRDMSPFSTQASGNEIVHLTYHCAGPVRDLSVSSEAFLDFDDKHVQTFKLVQAGDLSRILAEGMLNNKQRELHVDNVQEASSLLVNRVWRFLKLGVEHILTGYDHILFVIAVILVTTGMRDTLKVVTSFTVAHSITLALAFFGVLSLPASVVEPLIALTIVYVAFENIFVKRFQQRWLLTFLFGLVHGLGFVTVLKEITMSKDELLSGLIAFNVGIELGQLLIVVPFVAMLYALRDRDWQPRVVKVASLATGLAGFMWLIERVPFGPLLTMARRLV